MERKKIERVNQEAKSYEGELALKQGFAKIGRRVLTRRVSHIGIVVRDIYEALAHLDKLFEFVKLVRIESLPEQGIKLAIISLDNVEIEVLQPTNQQTGVARFLEHRGEGLHHIGFEVEDISESLRSLGQKGARLIDKEPWHGVRGKTAFVHPASVKGVLIELVEKD